MATAFHIPAPPAAITRILSRFDREQLEGFVAVAIDLMDLADGDTDLEETDTEDAFAFSSPARYALNDGPGCPISDPGEHAVDDEGFEYSTRKLIYGIDQSKGPLEIRQ